MIVNVLGAFFMVAGLVAAFVVGGIVDAIRPNTNGGVLAGCLVFFLITPTSDLIYRWRNFRERGYWRYIHPFTGGMWFFVPIWICFGVGPLVAGPIMMLLAPEKKNPPRVANASPHHEERQWNIERWAKRI
ncbi:MAG: hypothetical protein K2V38_18125 [Gemmataceae bacterium]|nr:hypothetical protein [Gemmataceae bacterium]